MFRFSLDALHRVRKRKEEERQKELAEVMKVLKDEEASLDQYRHEITEKLHEQQEINKTSYDNNMSILYDKFQAGRKLDVQDKTDLIERINEVVVEKRQGVLKAYIDRKVIDNFKKRKQEEYINDEKKAEENEIGEMVTMGFRKFRKNAQWCTVLLISLSFMALPACGGKKQPELVDAMNQKHEAAKMEENTVTEEQSVELLRDTLNNQRLQNHQLLIEMANLKEKMIELERLQAVPEVKQVMIEVKNPQTQEVVTQTKEVYEAKVLYKLGYNALKSKAYDEARGHFNNLLSVYPNHFLADNCIYWIGESYYDEQDYKTAIHHFQRVEQVYPKGNKVPDALIKTAYSYYNLGRKNLAMKAVDDFLSKYPDSSLKSLANTIRGKIQAMK